MFRQFTAAALGAALAFHAHAAGKVYRVDVQVVVDGNAATRHALKVAEGEQKALDISPEVQLRYKGEPRNAGTTLALYKKVGNAWEPTATGTQSHPASATRQAYAFVCTNPPGFGIAGAPMANLKFSCLQK